MIGISMGSQVGSRGGLLSLQHLHCAIFMGHLIGLPQMVLAFLSLLDVLFVFLFLLFVLVLLLLLVVSFGVADLGQNTMDFHQGGPLVRIGLEHHRQHLDQILTIAMSNQLLDTLLELLLIKLEPLVVVAAVGRLEDGGVQEGHP